MVRGGKRKGDGGKEGGGRREGGMEGDVDSMEGAVRERLYDCLYGRTVGGWDCWCVGGGVGMWRWEGAGGWMCG